MAKRPASPDVDQKPIKRARTDEEDAPKREKKARRAAEGSEEEYDNEQQGVAGEELQEDEERQFEEENEAELRRKIESKRAVQGGIAECGVIQSIEMHNFMCHTFLSFKFGPQINFIIGMNGSGKSAVLSAITVALGGNANDTGRGKGLKSFVKEGQSIAEVSIKIKNEGEEAYRPRDYGKSIIISRRFSKEGSSTWKVQSTALKTISTKRDEVSAMCDHFNLQVSNPLSVLTQDSARAFLSASAPTDKYKFFLRGTQLSQLSEEYDTCLENITTTNKILSQKKEALPDLKAAFDEVSSRFKEASKARQQRHKVDDLKKELAWAHVAAKEQEMTKKVQDVVNMQSRIPRIEAKVEGAKAGFEEATQRVTDLEAEFEVLGDIEHLNTEKINLQNHIREQSKLIAEQKSEQKKMNQNLTGAKHAIKGFNERIAIETDRLEKNTGARRAETAAKIEAAREAVKDTEKKLRNIEGKLSIQDDEASRIKNEGYALDQRLKAADSAVRDAQRAVERCHEQEKDNMAPYGTNMNEVLQRIARMEWAGDRPLGPLGLHVNVRDPKWAPMMRAQLGALLTSFVITDARDRERLKRVLDETRNKNDIVIGARDLFDYSSGEPGPEYPTMLRALECSDPFVLRVLINHNSIEKTLITSTRREADDMLNTLDNGGSAFSADGYRVIRYPEGGGSSARAAELRRDDRKNMLFTGRDAKEQSRHCQEVLARAKEVHVQIDQEYRSAQQKYNAARKAADAFRNEGSAANKAKSLAKQRLSNLMAEANEETPANIAGIEEARAESEQEVESLLSQFKQAEENIAQINAIVVPLQTQLDAVRTEIAEFDDKRTKLSNKIQEAVAHRMTQQHNQEHYEKTLATELGKIGIVQDACNTLEEEFKGWTTKALEYCARWENPRFVDQINADLKKTEAALAAREKVDGATVEQMTIEVNKAQAAMDNATADYKNMTKLNKMLRKSLIERIAKWQEFRRHIALRCKLVFQYHLANRGYFGKVIFDHIAGTLALKVQTDDQVSNTQGGRDKDPRSLSGGEKSFSTICLLLSLWESIGCPLRCLDEFDVFMDAQNRRISMRMMIDTANASDKKQYVLITPQDMNNVKPGPTVRVLRMNDPERNQPTLQF